MTRQAKALLAGVALTGLSGVGVAAFSALAAIASAFSGPFGSGSGTSAETGSDFVTLGLGEDVSFARLTVAGDDNSADAITILSGRLRFAPSTTASAVLYWSASNGFNFGNQVNMCDGCYIAVDNIAPKQSSVPLTLGDGDGTAFFCQASPGTCDATHKGAVTCVSESASSATRLCRCIRTSSTGDYRWLNMDNATRGTTTTDCPDTTP